MGEIRTNGARLFYKVAGSGGPVIVLHGGPGLDHSYIEPHFHELLKEHQFVFYDQRGSGESDAILDPDQFRPEVFTEDLDTLRKHLGLVKINLLGHSWGGLLALLYAARYPDHAQSIVAVSPMGTRLRFFLLFGLRWMLRVRPKVIIELRRKSAVNTDRVESMKRLCEIIIPEYLFDKNRRTELTLFQHATTARNFVSINRYVVRHLISLDMNSYLAGINCPTLVLHGREDISPICAAKEIHKRISCSQFVSLDQCGHFPFVEKKAAFNAMVRKFWNQSSGSD